MDQREYPRVTLQSEASIRHGKRDIKGILANLSLTGIYVRTQTQIPVGAVAEITFHDTASDGKATVKISCNVVRTDEEGIAFKLRQMDVDSFIHLHMIVSRGTAAI